MKILTSQSSLSQAVIYIHKVFDHTDKKKDQNRIFTFLRYVFSFYRVEWNFYREKLTRIDLGMDTLGVSGHLQKKAFLR